MLVHRQGATAYLHIDESGEKQKEALEIIKDYPKEPLDCICGHKEDELIADTDRFGFPMNLKLCRNCGLLRTDPYFTEEALNRFYAGPYRDLDNQLGTFDEVFAHEMRQAGDIEKVWHTVTGFEIGRRICEIGCGAGGALNYFKETGREVVGYDSGAIAEYGRSRGLDIRETWPEEEAYDTILMLQVFEHFRDPIGTLRKIKKMLNPSGNVLINVPGIFLTPFAYRLDMQRYFILTHPWHYTRDTLDYVAKLAGFDMAVGTEAVTGTFEISEEKDEPNKDIAKIILRFLFLEEGIFQIFRNHDPAIVVAMRKTKFGADMLKALGKY